MFLSFSVDSDSIFGKNAPCQLLRLNLKKSFIFLATVSRLNCPLVPDSVPVELHSKSWIEKVTSSTYEFNFAMCEPS